MKVKGFCNGKSFLPLLVICLFLLLGTYKTGIAGINRVDSISADCTSENTLILNTTMKAPFHHSTTALSPVPTFSPSPSPTPLSTPSTSPIKEGVVYGFVQDVDNNPLQDVKVTIEGTGFSEETVTDEYGFFVFEELASGDYTLEASKTGYQTHTEDLTLEDGEALEVYNIIMSTKGKIWGYAGDCKQLKICLKSLNQSPPSIGIKKKCTHPDDDGYFEFTDLEAGTYIIYIKQKRYRTAKKIIDLEAGEEKKLEIECKRMSKEYNVFHKKMK